MADLKSRIRSKLFRRNTIPTPPLNEPAIEQYASAAANSKTRDSLSSQSLNDDKSEPAGTSSPAPSVKALDSPLPDSRRAAARDEDLPTAQVTLAQPDSLMTGNQPSLDSSVTSNTASKDQAAGQPRAPELVLQEPSPDTNPPKHNPLDQALHSKPSSGGAAVPHMQGNILAASETTSQSNSVQMNQKDAVAVGNHLNEASPQDRIPYTPQSFSSSIPPLSNASSSSMLHRKIWVRRPNGAATIVAVREDDMVDEAKDMILHKFKNSLGRHFDAPDVTIRIVPTDGSGERTLNPDEILCKALDSGYPAGQSMAEALVIDVPHKNKTPKHSPRPNTYPYYQPDEIRPHENGTDYFPLMPIAGTSPAVTNMSHDSRQSHANHERAMTVLTTGHVPPLPSPGATSRRTHGGRQNRPGHIRQLTASPTTLTSSVNSRQGRPRLDSTASSEKLPVIPLPTAMPTPPIPETTKVSSTPGTPRVASPRPGNRRKTKQKPSEPTLTLPPGILDTAVPPINVLIVEDNHINMKLLEQFVRRLKVRWDTAVNGREAVNKWRNGGFHLVLMDIQLPIMSGLEATKEIRRLERVNNIGAFSNTPSDPGANEWLAGDQKTYAAKDEDKLGDPRMFKSPVIIVALTASNLQSDRHEALAAGCNDFLTKVRPTE